MLANEHENVINFDWIVLAQTLSKLKRNVTLQAVIPVDRIPAV